MSSATTVITMYPVPIGKLGPDDLALVGNLVEDKLRHVVDKLGHETWHEGLNWYPKAHGLAHEWAQDYGVPFDFIAGIIAALSPRISWEYNLLDTLEILEWGDEASTHALGPNVAKALWILSGSDPDSNLGGRKVRSFWHNITSPHSSYDVTLDSWMVRLLELPSHRYLERVGVYDAISDAFRTVALDHGVMPHQLQAALWIHIRKGNTSTMTANFCNVTCEHGGICTLDFGHDGDHDASGYCQWPYDAREYRETDEEALANAVRIILGFKIETELLP